jgi:hypothetical protein
VAPHGGRRDPGRRPWSDGGLRTNDLHTAELTRELAVATGAAALVNADVDRNDVDLNRISTAHDGAPRFLETLAELLEAALARCERAVVLAIHGWNVVQPSVDVGIGYRPGRHAPSAPPGPTASAEFLRGGLTGMCATLAARGIGVSLGARYPARAPENLLQLFSERHTADARPLVHRLAQLGRRCDGVQLELAVPLRWPGPWRTRMIASVVDALPALLGRRPETALMPAARPEPAPGTARTFEFVGPDLCGLAALDRAGARLLLFERDGTLALFTGERIGGEADGTVGGLSLHANADGGRRLRYDGPLLRFPDTTPFVDLEAGMAGATLLDARCAIDFTPAHAGCAFGSIDGEVVIAGQRRRVSGTGVADHDDWRAATRWRAALAVDARDRLLLRRDASGAASGHLCRGGTHIEVVAVERAGGDHAERVTLRLATGEDYVIDTVAGHRLPVVRGGAVPPVRVEFTAHRLRDAAAPAGWCFTTLPASPDA